MILPTKIEWISAYSVTIPGMYQEVLVALHKHSAEDWNIVQGAIQPINGYKEYEIRDAKGNLIEKSKILGVGIYPSYGRVVSYP